MQGRFTPIQKTKNLPRERERSSFLQYGASYQDGMTVPLYFSRMKAFTSGLW